MRMRGRILTLAGIAIFWTAGLQGQIPLDHFKKRQEAAPQPESGATAQPGPAEPAPRAMDQFSPAELNRRLAIVVGNEGTGSAFLAVRNGKTVLLTNTHVIAGSKDLYAQTIGGDRIELTGLEVAEKYDVASLEQETAREGFELIDDLEGEVKLGDPVVVLGNSGGSGVATEIPGNVTGIGPELIEVSAKFIPGNSGSPVIHLPTGKVIGIATFITMREYEDAGKSSRFNQQERHFAYRLDNIPGWESVNWPVFLEQGQLVNAIRHRTEALWNLAEDIVKREEIRSGSPRYRIDAKVDSLVENFENDLSRQNVGQRQVLDAQGRLIRSLLHSSDADIETARRQKLHSFFREEVKKQAKQREGVKDFFDKLNDAIRDESR